MPSFCPEKPDPSVTSRFHKNTGGLAKMRALLPNAHYGAPQHPFTAAFTPCCHDMCCTAPAVFCAGPCWCRGPELFKAGAPGSFP